MLSHKSDRKDVRWGDAFILMIDLRKYSEIRSSGPTKQAVTRSAALPQALLATRK